MREQMKSGIELNISFRNEPSIQSGDLHMMHGLYEMEFYGLHEAAAPWRDLPERYGRWNTVYKKFCKWQEEQ